jgi:hypothetical protein
LAGQRRDHRRPDAHARHRPRRREGDRDAHLGLAARRHKDARRRSGIVAVSSLTVVRGRHGEFTLTLRYSYADRPPSFAKRVEVAKQMLRESLTHLEHTP